MNVFKKIIIIKPHDTIVRQRGNHISTIFSKEIERLLENGYKIEGHIAKKIK